MSPRPAEADFGIEINFQPGSDAPARVFKAMTALIETFESIDRELVNSVAKIQPVLLLEDIEAGSVKTWLRTQLESLKRGYSEARRLNRYTTISVHLAKNRARPIPSRAYV